MSLGPCLGSLGWVSIPSHQLCINTLMNINICTYEVYKPHGPHPQSEPKFLRDHRQVRRLHNKCGLTMILYDVPSDIARNILDITFHT